MGDDSSSTAPPPPGHGRGRKRMRRRTRSKRSCPEVRRSGRRRVEVDKSLKAILSSMDSSSSSSSDSDNDQRRTCKRPRGYDSLKTPVGKGKRNIVDEIQPLAVDKSLTFKSVGGLEAHINKLKEMVIFPLLYKEFYANRSITPPRGVLFHGAPGTGKTLLARVLASEATCVGGREVTVFVRKGADVLNKWIGESERHLKLLFEQAVFKQPSIIFFDEIDGLAPMRSSKTDQIHNSVVSTLLAEMDGLKDRGDVIVIGATNRIDTIDPALRRPGRFDLEFQFLLPSYQGRRDIFEIHLSTWKPPVPSEMMDELALLTVGYSGADIKLVCAEASVCALRRRYPQIYRSNQKFVLDYDSIKVEHCDWVEAMKVVGRSAERSVFSSFFTPLPLPRPLDLLLTNAVEEVQAAVRELFPHKSKVIYQPSTRALLIDMGVNHDILQHVISASLWDSIDGVPIHILTNQTLATKAVSVEDGSAVALFFSEVKRGKAPAIIYIPYLDHFLEFLSSAAQQIFDQEMNAISFYPVLTIAFCETDCLQAELRSRFHECRLSGIPTKQRCLFFRKMFINATSVRVDPPVLPEEELEIAPPEPVRMNPEQLAWTERSEARTMCELRAFLREVIFKLLRRKKFAPFSKAVDPLEVPDYLSVISYPMDLEKMMLKVTNGQYHSAHEFLADINLIVENCLEYNPTKTDEDRELRCTAIELKDVAKSIIDREMDSEFEDNCIKITKLREERRVNAENTSQTDGGVKSESRTAAPYHTAPTTPLELRIETPSSSTTNSRRRGHVTMSKKRRRVWSRGEIKKPKYSGNRKESVSSVGSTAPNGVSTTTPVKQIRKTRQNSSCDSSVLGHSESSNQEVIDGDVKLTLTDCMLNAKSEKEDPVVSQPDADGYIQFTGSASKCKEYKTEVKKLYEAALRNTMNYSVRQLLEFRFKVLCLIDQHGNIEDKPNLMIKLWDLVDSCRPHEVSMSQS